MSFTESLEEVVRLNPHGLLSAHPTWGRVPLGLVFDVQNGFPFESRHFNSSGEGMPLLRIRDVVPGSTETYYSDKFDDAFVVNRGDIVVGMDGDFKCRTWRGAPALLNQRVCRLRPKSDCYSTGLLAHVLQGYLDAINAKTSAITVKHLSSRTIEDIPLPMPPPQEQGRIVEVIDSYLTRLDDAVASLERVQAKLKAYRASVLKAAVEGRLVPTEASLARAEKRAYEPAEALLARIVKERRHRWEEAELAKLKAAGKTPKDDNWKAKYQEPMPPDTNRLPELPEGWCWATVDQLSVVVRGASPRPAGDPRFFGGSVPWITVGSLTADEEPYLRHVSESLTEAGRRASRFVDAGTLLLTNSGATLGVPKITLIGGCINDGSVALLHVQDQTKLYLYFFLKTLTQSLRSINQGAAQPNLNTGIVRNISVSVPTSRSSIGASKSPTVLHTP